MITFLLPSIEVHGLPPREAEALGHIALGRSSKDVARLMAISDRTVDDHLEKSMRRLDARNRYELITKAFIAGVLRARHIVPTAALCLFLALTSVTDSASADANQFLRARPGSVRVVRTNTKNNNRKDSPEPVL